ncbi:unnamed protein product [Prorocentrum cordatum]|uniref:Uncharacterized protein n=1 Tax=Prorocentrum cordatum TaxID=2364126 RepID=A0ABN9PHA1_9DINO|nr:unnamed protein product [Polarella glacialis]
MAGALKESYAMRFKGESDQTTWSPATWAECLGGPFMTLGRKASRSFPGKPPDHPGDPMPVGKGREGPRSAGPGVGKPGRDRPVPTSAESPTEKMATALVAAMGIQQQSTIDGVDRIIQILKSQGSAPTCRSELNSSTKVEPKMKWPTLGVEEPAGRKPLEVVMSIGVSLTGNQKMIYDNIIQDASDDGQREADEVRTEMNNPEKLPNESCLSFEARWEKHHWNMRRASLVCTEAEDFVDYATNIGKMYSAVIRFDMRDYPKKDGGTEHMTPKTWQEARTDTTFFSYGAAIKTLTDVEVPSVTCEWSTLNWECQPSADCVLVGNSRSGTCSPKVEDTSIAGWEMVGDGQLSKVVAPTASDGSDPVTELKGFSATFYCGPKSAFTEAQPGPTTEPASLKACLEAGVRSNAELHAAYPWKLYFPEEVVAMVVFAEYSPRQCSEGTSGTIKEQLCADGATETASLDSHLSSDAKESSGSTYQGLATGSGYPQSMPTEVWLRPEDLLEAAGLLARS